MNRVILVLTALLITTAAEAQRRSGKKFQYEQVSFEDMIHRYLHRDGQPASEVEGIYSVSCVITRSRRHWLTGRDVVRIVERKDNYARVAILKETMNTKRDFIEVSMSNRDATKYPIVGELNVLAEGGGYIYKHMEPDGQLYTFSMLLTHSDLLEGQYAYTKRKKMITTKLSYFKLYPKTDDGVVRK
jgi:hypothetical protein